MFAYSLLLVIFILFALLRYKKSYKPFDLKNTLPLRGFLAIGIVLHHTAMKYVEVEDPAFIFSVFKNIGAPIVAVFFFLTGYGLCISLAKKGTSYLDDFIKKRLRSFLPEFLFLSIAMVGVIWLLYDISIKDQSIKLVFDAVTPLPNSWFIYAIIYVYFAFYFSSKISRCNVWKSGVIFSGLILLYAMTLAYFGYTKYLYNSIFSVILGYYVAYFDVYPHNLLIKFQKYGLYVLCAIIGISTFWLDYAAVRFIVINISAIAVYFCVRYYGFPQWKWLNFIGVISLNIYLIHGIFLRWIQLQWNCWILHMQLCIGSSCTIILAESFN